MGHRVRTMQTMVPLSGASAYHAGNCHSKALQEHGDWYACKHQTCGSSSPCLVSTKATKKLVMFWRLTL